MEKAVHRGPPVFSWVNESKTSVVLQKGGATIDQQVIQKVVQDQLGKANEILFKNLLFGASYPSIFQRVRQGALIQCDISLSREVLQRSAFASDITLESRNSSELKLAADNYLNQIAKFKQCLLILLYITPGLPPRIPELLSLQTTGSNISITSGKLILSILILYC